MHQLGAGLLIAGILMLIWAGYMGGREEFWSVGMLFAASGAVLILVGPEIGSHALDQAKGALKSTMHEEKKPLLNDVDE